MPNTLKRKTRKLWFSPNGDKLQHYQESSIMTLDASYNDSNNHPTQSESNNHNNNIHNLKTKSIISNNHQQSKPKKKWFAKRNVNAIQSTPGMIPTQYYYYHNQQSIVDHYHHHQHYPPQEDSNQFHTIIETNKIPKRSNRTKWYVMNVHPQPSSSSSHNPTLSAESTKTTTNNHNYNHNHSNAHIIPAAAEYSSCSQSIISSKCPSSHNTAVLNFSGEGGSSKVITSNTRFSQHTNHHHDHHYNNNNKSISSSKRKYRSRFKLCPSLLWVCSITTTTKSNKKLSVAGADGDTGAGDGGAGGNDEKNSQSEDVPQKHVDWKDRLFLLRKQPHYVGAGAGAGVGSKVGNNLDSTTGTTSLSARTTLQKKRGRRLYGGGLLCRLEEGSECSFSENRIH